MAYYGTDPHRWSSDQQKHLAESQVYEILASMNASMMTPTCVPRKNHFVAMVSLSRTVKSKMCHGSGCSNPNSHDENAPDTEEIFNTPMPSATEIINLQSNPECRPDIDSRGGQGQEKYQQWCCRDCMGQNPPEHCNQHCGDYQKCCPTFNQNNYQPPSLEARLQTGNVKVLLGNRLFQKGCLNYQCKSAIEPCNAIALEPAGNEAITPTPFNADKDKLLEKVAALSNSDVKSWDNLTQAFFEVSVASQAAGINDVVRLFSKMVTTEQVATTIDGVENYCDKEHWDHQNNRENPDWQTDPCCNWQLRETMCCAVKSVNGKMLTKISGVDMGVVKTFCNNPEKVKVVLNDLQTQLTKATEASAELGEKTGKKALDNLWKFKDICMKEVGMNQVRCFLFFSSFRFPLFPCCSDPSLCNFFFFSFSFVIFFLSQKNHSTTERN